MNEDTPVGQRIAYWRNRRGLTQEVLAGLVGRSASWLQKVEYGERVMDSVSMLMALARALKVSVADLQPRLGLPPNGGAPLDAPKGIHAVRQAILVERPADREPRPLDQLRAQVERVKQLNADGFYEGVARAVPGVLAETRAATAAGDREAWWCVAGAYQAAASLALTFGEADLGWIAADRAVTAAERAQDPLMVAVGEWRMAYALMRQGWVSDAAARWSAAADRLAPTAGTPVEGWAVWGSLQFGIATAASRENDAAGAWRALRDARAAADRVGPGRNDYWEAFGPASVGANEVMVALEFGDPVEALRVADRTDVEEMPTRWRKARFLIDVAQAYALRRDDAATVRVLLGAERHSAETVRYSVQAHELVRACLHREERYRTPDLRALAGRLGIAA